MVRRVMMDTNFWIYLKNNPNKLEEFHRRVNENEVKVLFSSGNFIDLLKYHEQDHLSKIIAETVDLYVPFQSQEGRYYDISEEPASLIPTPIDRKAFASQTQMLDDDLALRYLFRTADWETPKAYFEITESIRDIHDKYGFENSMGYIFREYLEEGDDKKILHQENVQPKEFIRKMLELHRIDQMKNEEKPDGNDFADMEICSHAILTNCDCLFIERKWINQNVIENVVDRLTLDGPELYTNYNNFLSNSCIN